MIGVAVTVVVARQTAAIDCAAAVGACLPVVEGPLGFAAGAGGGFWTAGSCRHRGADVTIASASAGLGAWWVTMRLTGPSICPSDSEAGVCSNGFLLGGALITLAAAAALLDRRRRLQRP